MLLTYFMLTDGRFGVTTEDAVANFKNAEKFIWFQEEHRNSGAWNYLAPRLNFILDEMRNEGRIGRF